MNPLEARLLAATLRTDLPTIDLHGQAVAEALEKLEIFLYTIYKKNESVFRVITGIGTGVLQKAVEDYMRNHPLVEAIHHEAGNLIVLMK